MGRREDTFGRLGFGGLRLPLTDAGNQQSIDADALNALVDLFLARGFTHFDTAYTYHGYRSEKAIREALVRRHRREEFSLATKLAMHHVKCPEDQVRLFAEQLENCGVSYFDYYFLHNIGAPAYHTACAMDSFEFGQRLKREGKIKKFGISFHDTPELLDEILTNHPELDVVLLQINYLDWESPGIQSRRCYEVARKHGMPVFVMEPCKGGVLANLPKRAERLLRAFAPDASPASWAIRFAAGLAGVSMVLSGMSTQEQVRENTSVLTEFVPLSDAELRILDEVVSVLHEEREIPCTACRYCEEVCPNRIAIPDYFGLYNSAKRDAVCGFSSQFVYYLNIAGTRGRAKECVCCGACEAVCPQHLHISRYLKEVSAEFDVPPAFFRGGGGKQV
ncbi:MAG TPA: aldo/keto reductase [Methanocorpusculum sp.]|nr:aldo/keto reductase [Methanocorpusculum sp.]HJK80588.1 aldo/keto reductase [Methanocorpusculum sp.]